MNPSEEMGQDSRAALQQNGENRGRRMLKFYGLLELNICMFSILYSQHNVDISVVTIECLLFA